MFITVAGTIGRVGKVSKELDGANLTENADRLIFTKINQDWLIRALQSSLIQDQIINATTKVGQPKLAIARIEKFLIALPPIEEQKRIIKKIDAIIPYIDKYNKIKSSIDTLNNKFPELLKNLFSKKLSKENLFIKSHQMNQLLSFWNVSVLKKNG